MALRDRPTLSDEAREAFLEDSWARLNELVPPHVDDVSPTGTPAVATWHNLGEEEPDPDPRRVNAAGMAAMVKFFALLEEERPSWQRDALCQEPEYADLPWFPERGDSTAGCKNVCDRCLVADECRTYAVEVDVPAGVWGGVSGRNLKRDAA